MRFGSKVQSNARFHRTVQFHEFMTWKVLVYDCVRVTQLAMFSYLKKKSNVIIEVHTRNMIQCVYNYHYTENFRLFPNHQYIQPLPAVNQSLRGLATSFHFDLNTDQVNLIMQTSKCGSYKITSASASYLQTLGSSLNSKTKKSSIQNNSQKSFHHTVIPSFDQALIYLLILYKRRSNPIEEAYSKKW